MQIDEPPGRVRNHNTLETGLTSLQVHPQLGQLKSTQGTIPTIQGAIATSITIADAQIIQNLTVPSNSTADLIIPHFNKSEIKHIHQNGRDLLDKAVAFQSDNLTWTPNGYSIQLSHGNYTIASSISKND